MRSQEILRHIFAAIIRCRKRLEEGTTHRFDADELERWISTLYTFREKDYAAVRKNREEIYHIIFVASALKAKIEQLHPVILFSPVMRRVKGYETRYYRT